MNTNIHISLTEDERRQISRHMFGSNKEVTRRELNILVEMFVGHMINGVVDDIQSTQPSVGQHAAPAIQPHAAGGGTPEACPPGANPKEWKDAGYRRAWHAVGKVKRKMR